MQQFAKELYNELLKFRLLMEIICVDGKAQRGTVLSNGRNPYTVSAYVPALGITLATEAYLQKSNEIKATPRLLDKIDLSGKIVTADAMSMQKEIIDKIRYKGGYFLIELKANPRALRYGVEDRLSQHITLHSYTYGPKTQDRKGRTQSRHHPKNCLFCDLTLERTPKKESRQKERNGRADEKYIFEFYVVNPIFKSEIKIIQFSNKR